MSESQARRDEQSRRQYGPPALMLALLFVLTACAGAASGEDGSVGEVADGGETTWFIPISPPALDPTSASAQGTAALLLGLEPLVRLSDASELESNLATMSQPNDTTYVFDLRDDVTFWNGDPLTAEDVKFSLELHIGKEATSVISAFYSAVESVERSGQHQVTVTLSEPRSDFPYTIAQTGIVQKAYYEAHGDAIGDPEAMNMGTGPFEFASFTPSSEIVLARNADYWGEPATFERLRLRTLADDAQRMMALRSGEADVDMSIPLGQVDSYRDIQGLTITEAIDAGVYKFNLETDKDPWSNPAVRAAFAHVVNRDAIVNGIFGGNAQAAMSLVAESALSRAAGGAELPNQQPTFDLEEARRLLAEADVSDLSTTVLVTDSDPNLSAIVQAVAQDAAKVGVELRVKAVDDGTYYDAVYFQHTTDGLTIDNFSAATPDPANIPLLTLDSAYGLPDGPGVNIADYRSAEVDSMLDQVAATSDDPERTAALTEVLELAQQDLPYVPVAHPKLFAGATEGRRISDAFGAFWWMQRWPVLLQDGSAGEGQG